MPSLSEYRAKIEAMTDDELVKEVADAVWLSAYASNNPRSKYHEEVDAAHDECRRREKPWLYQRGWNKAYRSQGYEPSAADIEAAKESVS